MKICFLADASSIHTFKWANYFAEKNYQISLISLNPPRFDYQKIEIFLIKRFKLPFNLLTYTLNFLPILIQIYYFKKKIKPDIYHALGSSNGWLGVLAHCCPLICTVADPGILDIPYQRKLPLIYKIFNKYTFRKANLLHTDGENIKEAIIKLGIQEEKIRIIRYGIDIDKFKTLLPDENLKEKIFNEKNIRIVISTKPLRKECDVETLIRAVPLIAKEVRNVRLLIVGDGEEKERLINIAKSLQVLDKIKFIGWVLPEDLPKYFNLADIFVCTSLVETGLASSTAEAMACGVPLVVSDSGDNKLFIKDGENGFIFPLKNSRILAKKVIALLKDSNLQKKFRNAHRKWIEENNNYRKEMAKMEKIYQSFIKK